jgi:hypothetical protein
MVLADIVLVIVVTYIVAKVLGLVISFIRQVMKYAQPTQTPRAGTKPGTGSVKKPMPYTNVEDIDYEDITDKK